MNDLQSPRYPPAHWLQRAQDVRAQANELEDPEAIQIFEQIAACYDRIAAWTERWMSGPPSDDE